MYLHSAFTQFCFCRQCSAAQSGHNRAFLRAPGTQIAPFCQQKDLLVCLFFRFSAAGTEQPVYGTKSFTGTEVRRHVTPCPRFCTSFSSTLRSWYYLPAQLLHCMFFQDGLTGSAWGDWANYIWTFGVFFFNMSVCELLPLKFLGSNHTHLKRMLPRAYFQRLIPRATARQMLRQLMGLCHMPRRQKPSVHIMSTVKL